MAEQSIPESRAYRHIQCQSETVVGGDAFEVVSNPMSSMETTQCTQCGAQFPISDFVWADTGETIAEYYARHSKSATDKQRSLCSKKVMTSLMGIGALLVGAGFFWLVKDEDWLVVALCTGTGLFIGTVVGGVIFQKGIEKPIVRKVCGVSDTRLLT